MKIIPGSYPEEANWSAWISFTKGPEISLVFLYRLAAYVRDVVQKPVSMYGFRTYAEQVVAYADYLAGGNIAAKPGTSWHGYGLAVDFNRIATVNGKGVYPGSLDDDYLAFAAGRSELMAAYGIVHTVKTEPWHIQPIETKGYAGDRSAFLDSDDPMNGDDLVLYKGMPACEEVKFWQRSLKWWEATVDLGSGGDTGVGDDGNFGTKTETATNLFKGIIGLPQDGVVDALTWGCMCNSLHAIVPAPVVVEVPTGITQEQLDAANQQILFAQADWASANKANDILAGKLDGYVAREAELNGIADAIVRLFPQLKV